MTLAGALDGAARFFRVGELDDSGTGPDPSGFAWIEPGEFTKGSPDTDSDRESNEGPQTIVSLTQGCWMDRYEVTQQEYLEVVGANPSRWQDDVDRPVESVSWSNATNYCHLLTEVERSSEQLPEGYAYRLPTEVPLCLSSPMAQAASAWCSPSSGDRHLDRLPARNWPPPQGPCCDRSPITVAAKATGGVVKEG